MAHKTNLQSTAEYAIQSIGLGYDVATDIRLKYCKQHSKSDPLLIELDHGEVRDIVLPGNLTVAGVPKSIKCDKGERMRFRSDVLSFQQMSEQFNRELSLSGKIPSGLFNTMFEFSGCWQKDAANTKSLAFDGWCITLYTVALSKAQIILRDHVKQAVPSTWEPAALARFIKNFGTHIVVGVKIGGKDVIYLKQQHSSSLQAVDVQKRLKEESDQRFLDANGHSDISSQDKDKVTWDDEKECFRTLAAAIGNFYALHPPILPNPSGNGIHLYKKNKDHMADGEYVGNDLSSDENDVDQELLAEAEAAWTQREWTIQHVLFPSMRLFLKPPKSMATDGTFVQVASLEKLYKIFERC
ncbi:hypothetical protein GUJ93_ZPchr0007g5648 [Zizania palustris]|uniref:MACPF domain-containing protein n=1 Tax=Zizania palustris TaxID=103762 RepID=A0A8J5T3X2_ZIZPA|nr:hypothetical protein GUJ93_ZPchr0007g5648 [Zizania palustris]